jgi:hypothetical protein
LGKLKEVHANNDKLSAVRIAKAYLAGWAFAHHLGTELVAAALAMALLHRRPGASL